MKNKTSKNFRANLARKCEQIEEAVKSRERSQIDKIPDLKIGLIIFRKLIAIPTKAKKLTPYPEPAFCNPFCFQPTFKNLLKTYCSPKYRIAFRQQISCTRLPNCSSSQKISPFSAQRPIRLHKILRKYSCRV